MKASNLILSFLFDSQGDLGQKNMSQI